MDRDTIEALLALNRHFYSALAAPFAASRPADDPALALIVTHIPPGARVLDVGCGNGRLAVLLADQRPGARYCGVDGSPPLIAAARASAATLKQVETAFYLADIARPGWSAPLAAETFDCAVALAVLQHIPSFELRLRVLEDIGALLGPAGRLILSSWQFLDSERLRRKIVPWAEIGMAEERLEAGDYLLGWERGGRGLRYCHLLDEAELQRLLAASGFQVEETFRAGGRQGNLSLFAVCRRKGEGDRS